jgi:hypothetical protein
MLLLEQALVITIHGCAYLYFFDKIPREYAHVYRPTVVSIHNKDVFVVHVAEILASEFLQRQEAFDLLKCDDISAPAFRIAAAVSSFSSSL